MSLVSKVRAATLASATIVLGAAATHALAAPMYDIIYLGVAQTGDNTSTGQAISTDGHYAAGFSGQPNANGSGIVQDHAFVWNDVTGMSGQPNLANPVRNFNFARGVNNSGTAVGFGATTSFFSGAYPVMWKNGQAIALPLPSGQTVGHAYSVNNSDVAAGSVGSSNTEFAATYTETGVTVLTQTTTTGGRLMTAYGINDAGRVVGQALDPNNASALQPFYLDAGATEAQLITPLPGNNAGIAFGVSNDGRVTGTSQNNGGGGVPFVWSESTGTVAIPLPHDTSAGSGRDVNSSGWVVGIASGLYAVPFLYDGTDSYDLQDLIPADSGWVLDHSTSNAAYGISEDGKIAGVGMYNGVISAFVMVPHVPEPASAAMIGLLAAPMIGRRRRRA